MLPGTVWVPWGRTAMRKRYARWTDAAGGTATAASWNSKTSFHRGRSGATAGEPEILVLQNGRGKHSSLDFTNYVAIDVCQGLRQGYIDSAPRLMEGLLQASKEEVEAKSLIREATRLSASDIAKSAIGIGLDIAHCPASLKAVLADRAFYRTSNRRS